MDLVLNCLSTTSIIALLSLILFCLCLFRFSKVASSKEVPTIPGAWPILGHLPLLSSVSQTPHRTLGALADKYGPLFTIKFGSKRALVLNNWEMAKECFTTIDMAISTRPKLVATELLAYNGAMFVFSPYGPYWRQVRKIANLEMLTNHRVEQLHHVCVFEVQTWIKQLFGVWSNTKNTRLQNSILTDLKTPIYSDGSNTENKSGYVLVELKQWFTQLTFNFVLRTTVGKRYFGTTNVVEEEEEEEAQRCVKALKELMRLLGVFTVGDAVPCLRMFDFGGHEKAMKKTSKELDKILDKWLEEHCKNRTLGEKVDRDDQVLMDVMMLSLLNGTTIDGFDADTIIKATILTLIAGGSDTTSVSLTWAICLLLKNPLVKVKRRISFGGAHIKMFSTPLCEESRKKELTVILVPKGVIRSYLGF